jgi:acetyl esterase/lipase
MKKILLAVFILSGFSLCAQQRFLDEVFSSVNVTQDVTYGANVSVITGTPALDTLQMDIYEPAGDTLAARPLIIYVHTGSMLPVPLNGQCTGDKRDSATIEMCKRFARKGYVVAAIDYRFGWNPLSPDQDTRTSTLLNAVYRGEQDVKSCVRYFRKTIATMSNPYKVDDTKIALGGQGTGGYIVLAYATVDSYADITIPKLLNLTTTLPYVDTSLSGDWDGYGGGVLNQPALNNPGYATDIHFVFNMGGALGDSSWLIAGNAPIVCFHVPNDPFAPYTYGPVTVPTTGQFVINVTGSYNMVRQSDYLGNNNSFLFLNLTDPYTQRANMVNDGYDGLCPLERPTWSPPFLGGEAGPWEWWDTTCTNNAASLASNPNMSKAKGMAYIDTVQGYLCPRMYRALGLNVGIDEVEKLDKSVKVFPNPSTGNFVIAIDEFNVDLKSITITDMTGKVVRTIESNGGYTYEVDRNHLADGVYFVKTKFTTGENVKRLVLE